MQLGCSHHGRAGVVGVGPVVREQESTRQDGLPVI
jgi:hypothetical protein